MIKLIVNRNNDAAINVDCTIKGTREDLADEIYCMIRDLERFHPEPLQIAITRLANELLEEEDD